MVASERARREERVIDVPTDDCGCHPTGQLAVPHPIILSPASGLGGLMSELSIINVYSRLRPHFSLPLSLFFFEKRPSSVITFMHCGMTAVILAIFENFVKCTPFTLNNL